MLGMQAESQHDLLSPKFSFRACAVVKKIDDTVIGVLAVAFPHFFV
jgi:hypothetical protein